MFKIGPPIEFENCTYQVSGTGDSKRQTTYPTTSPRKDNQERIYIWFWNISWTLYDLDMFQRCNSWGTWQAQSVEHATLDLRVVSLSLHAGCRDYLKKKKKKMQEQMNSITSLIQKDSHLLYTFLRIGKVMNLFLFLRVFCWPTEPVCWVNDKTLSFPERWPLTHSPSATLTKYALNHKL